MSTLTENVMMQFRKFVDEKTGGTWNQKNSSRHCFRNSWKNTISVWMMPLL